MSTGTHIAITGNLTADPELRFIQSGAAVVNFTVASTPRNFDRQANEWKDGETAFWRCSMWREAAENVAESLTKGMAVVVIGAIVSRSWDKDGQKRTEKEIQVDDIGPSLRRATAKVTRKSPTGKPASSGFVDATGYANEDPWASAPAPTEPPF